MTAPQIFRSVDEQITALRKGAAEIIPEEELRAKLERSRVSGKPLRVKLGVDPTAPDLHLGHTVVLRKLKHFQDEGHTAIFLVGDFTAMVGDPTGQSETRPPLTREQVQANAQTYLEQVYKLLDRERTEVRYNSEWLGGLSGIEIVRLCGHYRLARMLEREDFRSRLANNQAISVHELLYPLFQAYDSVALKADVELGATEQKFNLLVGRDIQREYGQQSQVAFTMPILVGTDGQRKMSKSLGNYVGITESPTQMFGKIMSISDELMWSYYDLLTDFAPPVIVRVKEEVRTGALHPMDAKMQLAHNIIAGFHGEDAARKASDEFRRVFRERQAPTELETKSWEKLVGPGVSRLPLARLISIFELAPSRSEAERLIQQGAVEWDGKKIQDPGFQIEMKDLELGKRLRVGKLKVVTVVLK
jgi:tyrosyl-tRNA synthetase